MQPIWHLQQRQLGHLQETKGPVLRLLLPTADYDQRRLLGGANLRQSTDRRLLALARKHLGPALPWRKDRLLEVLRRLESLKARLNGNLT